MNKDKQTDSFWNATAQPVTIERRVLWRSGKHLGELKVSIASDQPVPDLGQMSDSTLEAAVVPADKLSKDNPIAPQLVFGTARNPHHGNDLVVANHDGREVPVIQLGGKPQPKNAENVSVADHLEETRAAVPTAAIAHGDYAVGFLVRTDVIHFYPLLAVTLSEDIADYKEGTGTTSDVISLLPFQS